MRYANPHLLYSLYCTDQQVVGCCQILASPATCFDANLELENSHLKLYVQYIKLIFVSTFFTINLLN